MRLIDVDALKSDYGMKEDCADCDKELRGKSKACEYDRVYTKMDFCGWLDDAPTVDAVPVVHGRWIETKHGFCCNQCHTRRPLDWDGQMWLSSFCPNCGARMDGKDGHEEAD